ncbi:MAG TPA: YfhO family protein, partial [Dehalococcoidia bacterium]|nr:YfhO family protein [Dehalococcoidia bacterium]
MKGLLRRPDFLAFAFLLLLVLLFLWQGTLAGKALLPTDALFSFLPWRPYATQLGVGIPHNELIADMVLQNFGWKELIKSTLLQGQLPLWNPYVFTGMPLLAAGQGAALYPPAALLFTLLPIAQAYVWFTALHLLLGGLFTYFYLRVIGAGRWGALLAAAAFSLSGFLVVSFQWPQMVGAAVWLPFLLACLEQIFHSAERRPPVSRQEAWGQWLGTPFWTIAGAIGIGLQFLAGHLEISLYILFMLLAYAVVRLGLMTREQG